MKTYQIAIGSHTATVQAFNLVTALYRAKQVLKSQINDKIQVKILF